MPRVGLHFERPVPFPAAIQAIPAADRILGHDFHPAIGTDRCQKCFVVPPPSLAIDCEDDRIKPVIGMPAFTQQPAQAVAENVRLVHHFAQQRVEQRRRRNPAAHPELAHASGRALGMESSNRGGNLCRISRDRQRFRFHEPALAAQLDQCRGRDVFQEPTQRQWECLLGREKRGQDAGFQIRQALAGDVDLLGIVDHELAIAALT